MSLPVHIRWMIQRDMLEVQEIEDDVFEFPWTEEDFLRCLRQRNCIGMVAENAESHIVGYMIYELHKNRIHILSFAVARAFQRRGIGSQMVAKLEGKLSSPRRNRIMVEVRERNLPMQNFCKSRGFAAITVLRDFYEDTTEDAYLFEYRHIEEAPTPTRQRIAQ